MENKEFITRAMNYAQDHMENHELSLQNIADAAGFSLDYFNRMFQTHTGFTVMAYVNHIRLKKALLLLRNTDKTILEIALTLGYSSQEGFIKAFQKKYELTPSTYRKQTKNQLLRIYELIDETATARFLHDNPDFTPVDSMEVIEYLLDNDPLKYGRLCSEIKHMGIAIIAPGGDFQKGFIGIRALPMQERVLEIVTENILLLTEWLIRFSGKMSFYSSYDEEYLTTHFQKQGLNLKLKCRPHAVYTGTELTGTLPSSIQIRKLSGSDLHHIQKWAHGKKDAYINHLLTASHYEDACVLEYGVFENGELIAIAGCGIDEVHGYRLNDCCIIRFADTKETKALYRPIYADVTKLLWQDQTIPYDEVQFGEYARTHGDFTSVDLGYQIVNRKYDII